MATTRQDGPAADQPLQGEGNYEAARRYDEATTAHAQSGQSEEAARAAAPRSDAERRDLEAAEQEGRSHARGEDPALRGGRCDATNPDATRSSPESAATVERAGDGPDESPT